LGGTWNLDLVKCKNVTKRAPTFLQCKNIEEWNHNQLRQKSVWFCRFHKAVKIQKNHENKNRFKNLFVSFGPISIGLTETRTCGSGIPYIRVPEEAREWCENSI
jgi:hypothetical protein